MLPQTHVVDYRITATKYVAIVSVLVVLPFVFVHFIQGRSYIGSLLLVVVLILGVAARSGTKGQHLSLLLLFGFVPAVVALLGLSLVSQGFTASLWVFPTIMTFYLLLDERHAWLANALIFVVIASLSVRYLDGAVAVRVGASLFAVSMFSAILTRVITRQQGHMQKQIVTDSLTGVSGRILLADTLQQALHYCRTTGRVATIISLDIDHFKAINDRFGHEVGDDVLRALGAVLLSSVRKSDSVFRLGGEEFLLLLYDTDLTHGVSIAEKLRDAIAAIGIVDGLTISASFGVASSLGHQDWKAWVKRSDIKLYEAKRAGRNCVVSELPSAEPNCAPPNLAG